MLQFAFLQYGLFFMGLDKVPAASFSIGYSLLQRPGVKVSELNIYFSSVYRSFSIYNI